MKIYIVEILFPTDSQDDCDFVKLVYVDKERAIRMYPDAEITEEEVADWDSNPELN